MNNKEIKRANKSTGVWDRDEYRKAEHAKQAEETSGKSLEEMVDDLLRAVGFDMGPYDDGTFELSQEVEEELEKVVEDIAIERHQESLNHKIEINELVNQAIQDVKTTDNQIKKDINIRLISELQLGNIMNLNH